MSCVAEVAGCPSAGLSKFLLDSINSPASRRAATDSGTCTAI